MEREILRIFGGGFLNCRAGVQDVSPGCIAQRKITMRLFKKYAKWNLVLILVLGLGEFFYLWSLRKYFPGYVFPDTFEYWYVSDLYKSAGYVGISDMLYGRSFTLPLFYLVIGNKNTMLWMQLILQVFSFMWLSWVLSSRFKSRILSSIVACIPFMLSLAPEIFFWPYYHLTESLTISLFNFILATVLLKTDSSAKRVFQFTLLLFFCFWFSHLRDSNLYISAVLPLAVALYKIRQTVSVKMRAVWITAALVFGGGNYLWQTHLIQESARYKLPLVNVFTKRILTDDASLGWFERHGLPTGNHIQEIKGKWGYEFSVDSMPDLNSYICTQGLKDYQKFLFSHPDYMFCKPFSNSELNRSVFEYSQLDATKYVLFKPLAGSWGKIKWVGWAILLVSAGLLIVNWKYLIPFAFGYTVLFLSMLVSYHGDANEVARHVLMANYGIRMLLWIEIFFLLECTFLFYTKRKSVR